MCVDKKIIFTQTQFKTTIILFVQMYYLCEH